MMFMEVAEVASKRSTCYRGNVGCVIAKNNDVLSLAYNGAPEGEEHCLGNECPLYSETGGCMKADHAEKNAIKRALGKLRMGQLDGCIMYCTSSPCKDCAERIKLSRLHCFIYRNSYRDPTGMQALKAVDYLLIYRLTPSGYLINERTGMLEDA